MWKLYALSLGASKTLSKNLIELRQFGGLKTYIQDFDILKNRAEISEKQALVFFIGGLKIEIKNPSPLSRPKLHSSCNFQSNPSPLSRPTTFLDPYTSLNALEGIKGFHTELLIKLISTLCLCW